MTYQAKLAIRAAKNRTQWGNYAARKYVMNRNINLGLYRLARQLEGIQNKFK